MQVSLTFSSYVQNFPGYATLQVHTENSILNNLEKVNKQFLLFNNQSSSNPVTDGKALNEYCSDLFPEEINLDQERIGYISALKYIEEYILSQKPIQLTPIKFLEEIKNINWLLTHHQFYRGEYRPEGILLIWNEEIMPEVRNSETFAQLDKYIQTNCSPTQKELWKTTRVKIWECGFKNLKKAKTIEFSIEEKELIKSFVSFPPESSLVPHLMSQFVLDLFRKIESKEDVFLIMAWVHYQLIEIHPFVDGNGRTARVIMNLIRMLTGQNPLLFDHASLYLKEVRSALQKRSYEEFAIYLRTLESKQIKLDAFLDKYLRSIFDNFCKNLNWSKVDFLQTKKIVRINKF